MIEPMLYDVIETLYHLETGNLPPGSRGTIVHQLTDDVFEVEFIDDAGQTVVLTTLLREQFVVVWRMETSQPVSIAEQVAQIVSILPQQSGREILDFAYFLSSRQRERIDQQNLAAT